MSEDKKIIEVAKKLGVEVDLVRAFAELYDSKIFSEKNLNSHFVKDRFNKYNKENNNEESQET